MDCPCFDSFPRNGQLYLNVDNSHKTDHNIGLLQLRPTLLYHIYICHIRMYHDHRRFESYTAHKVWYKCNWKLCIHRQCILKIKCSLKFIDLWKVLHSGNLADLMLLFWKYTWSVPFRVADTFSTLALSVIRTRAKFTFKTITRKVVAFTIIPWHNL